VAQILNLAAKAAMDGGAFLGIRLPNDGARQLMLQFADNTTFMLEGRENHLRNLVQLLCTYAQAMGLHINWDKSLDYWFAPGPAPPWLATFDFPWAIERNLSKLLGTPFGLNLHTPDIDTFLVEKVEKKLRYWVNVHLFLAGRATIVKSVISI
jgi:hypothetical protein